jgi:hypothetical protein
MLVSQEYSELGANMRHYSELRFTRLTVFLLASGGLLGAQFAGAGRDSAAIVIPVLGIVLTVGFWRMVFMMGRYYWHFRTRAAALEGELSYQQYTTLPPQRGPGTSFVIGVLFVCFLLLWLVFLVEAFCTGA